MTRTKWGTDLPPELRTTSSWACQSIKLAKDSTRRMSPAIGRGWSSTLGRVNSRTLKTSKFTFGVIWFKSEKTQNVIFVCAILDRVYQTPIRGHPYDFSSLWWVSGTVRVTHIFTPESGICCFFTSGYETNSGFVIFVCGGGYGSGRSFGS